MKKKMLLSGCSHSTGAAIKDINKSWGNIFASNNNYDLTNVASNGCSLQYSLQQIINKISEEEYDVVILQLPDLLRYPLPYNGEDAFFNNDITNYKKNTPEVFHLNCAHYIQTDGSNKYSYFQLVSGQTYLKSIGGKFPINNEIIKYFYENVTFSTFYLNTIINEIYLLQQLLKYKNIDFILIPYDDASWGYNDKMSLWRFENSKKIDKTRYVDYPFMKWLRDNYNNPNDYYGDNGFHLNEEGHILFAEVYLPSFIKIN